MNYTYDAVIERDGAGYAVSFPQFPEAITFGATREEAAKRAAEVLILTLAERIEDGRELPLQERTAEVLAVNVEVTGEVINQSKCYTIDQAAEELGVTAGRVSQLASSGKLQAITFGKKRMVTIASVNERKANPPAAHRPKKQAVTSAK
jgi:excisionase family DNA binding protein